MFCYPLAWLKSLLWIWTVWIPSSSPPGIAGAYIQLQDTIGKHSDGFHWEPQTLNALFFFFKKSRILGDMMPSVPDAYRRITQETSSNSNKKENCPSVTESALILLVF